MTLRYIKRNNLLQTSAEMRRDDSVSRRPRKHALHRAKRPLFMTFALFAMIMLPLLFASCGNMFTEPVSPSGSGAQSGQSSSQNAAVDTDIRKTAVFSIHGELQTEGALPEEIVEAQRNAAAQNNPESSRTALPGLPAFSAIRYEIEIYQGVEGHVEDSKKLTESDGVIAHVYYNNNNSTASYSIDGLRYGAYTLIAKAYIDKNGERQQILESAGDKIVLDEDNPLDFVRVVLRPLSRGSGNISLDIAVDTTKYSCEAALNRAFNPDDPPIVLTSSPSASDTNKLTMTADGIASGSYTFTFSFYKTSGETGILVYQFDEVLNVCDGLTTSVWMKNGDASYLVTSSTADSYECRVTDSMIEQFIATNYYVDSENGDDSNLGSYFAPFGTISRAIDYVNASGGNKAYTIRVKGTFNESLDISEEKTSGLSSLTIKKASPDATAILDGTGKGKSVVTIKTSKPVTLENLIIQNGSTEESGGGIYIEDNANVTIYGCSITGNTSNDNGGGICAVTSSGEIVLSIRNSTIFGNTSYSEGGGMFIMDANGTVTMQNTEISSNSSTSNGGGVRVWQGAPVFTNCSFSNNTAGQGGALSVASAIYLDGNTFISAGSGEGQNDIYLSENSAKIGLRDNFAFSGGTQKIFLSSYNEDRDVFTGSAAVVGNARTLFTLGRKGYEIDTNGKVAVIRDLYVASSSSSPAGNDTTGTGTTVKPFATVTKALQTINEFAVNENYTIHIKGTVSGKIAITPETFTVQPNSITICGTDMTTDGVHATIDFDPVSIDPDNLDAAYAAMSVINNSFTNPVTLKNLKITADVEGFDPEDPESLNVYVSVYNKGNLTLENYDETPSNEYLFGFQFLGGNENVYLGIKGKVMMNVSLPEGKLINITGVLDNSSRIGVFVDEGNEPTAPTAASDGTVTVTSGLGANSGLSATQIGTVFYSADDESYAVRMNAAGTEVVVGLSGGSFTPETLSDRLYFTLKNAATGGNNVTSFYTGYSKDLYITATRGSGANATVVSPSNLTYSIKLKCGGATTATLLSTTQTPTVQGNAVKVTIPTTVEYPYSYTLFVQATYSENGLTYDASFSLEGKERLVVANPAPAGFVGVLGATVTGAVGSGDTVSSVFIAGRTVEIPDMYVCDHEVTQAEYQAVMGMNPSNFTSNPANGETQANRPVEQVSWYAALVYCNRKSIAENLTPCYTINGSTNPTNWGTVPTSSNNTWNAAMCNFNANGYRLPTEAEWEYVARGGNGLTGTQTAYSGTDSESDLANYAWYSTNSGNKTHEVRKKNANSIGIYDMSANVWEWCWDWYGNITSGMAATGASSGSNRVVRGGSWGNDASFCRVVNRFNRTPDYTGIYLGFRVVRSSSE